MRILCNKFMVVPCVALIMSGFGASCRPASAPTSYAQVNPTPFNTLSYNPINTLKAQSDAILSLAFTPDGKSLVTASRDYTVKLWNLQTGQVTQTMQHKTLIWSVAITPNGKVVASGNLDNCVRLWDAKTGLLLRTLSMPGAVSSVAFSPNGKLVASAGRIETGKVVTGGQASVWDATTGKSIQIFHSPQSSRSVVFSPDGKLILVGGYDKTVKLWNVKTGRLLKTFIVHGGIGHDGRINQVAFSPGGTVVAGGGQDGNGTVWLWNSETGALLNTLHLVGKNPFLCGLSFSSDGKVLASATLTNIQLWDVGTGKSLKSWEDKDGTYSLAFTPDRKHLATGSKERLPGSNIHGAVKFWSAK